MCSEFGQQLDTLQACHPKKRLPPAPPSQKTLLQVWVKHPSLGPRSATAEAEPGSASGCECDSDCEAATSTSVSAYVGRDPVSDMQAETETEPISADSQAKKEKNFQANGQMDKEPVGMLICNLLLSQVSSITSIVLVSSCWSCLLFDFCQPTLIIISITVQSECVALNIHLFT